MNRRLSGKQSYVNYRPYKTWRPLIPQKMRNQRQSSRESFHWNNSNLTPEEIARIEEFHDIFARHRFDIGMNEDFKVKLTPKDGSPAYSQSPSALINFKVDILVELAMLHRYGIITTLPFS